MNIKTYRNPVYPGSCPDPFVLKYGGEYFAYCTGTQPDGRCFGVFRSPDLVNWEVLPGALAPLPGGHTHYWAPEVTYHNGLFYMYYSVGNEVYMELRVAVAAQPDGPFEDSGHTLTTQQFAIDAHVFKDDDGTFYLFYATDFLDHPRIGTGTVMDRLLDPFTPEGKPRPVTRAQFDWQIYDPNRAEKGGVRWHTIEGSFVLKHHDKYYQMFSGGNWQNLSYGVGYATTETLERPGEWDQAIDGEKVLPVLRTNPGKVVGPGHNSVVRGPDNRQLYCVYHRWSRDGKVRQMAIDPLDWAGDRLIVLGPTFNPQLYPTRPAISGFAGFDKANSNWSAAGGSWEGEGSTLYQREVDEAAAVLDLNHRYFLLEVELKALEVQPGGYGLGLNCGEDGVFSFLLEPGDKQARLIWLDEEDVTQEQTLPLPADFNPTAFHLVRLEVQGRRVSLRLDGVPVNSGPLSLACKADQLRLLSLAAPVAFAGFGLTPGFEDSPSLLADTTYSGWRPEISAARGFPDPADAAFSSPVYTKGDLLEDYELVVNLLLEDGQGGEIVFYPAWRNQASGPEISFSRGETGWQLQTGEGEPVSLPTACDPKNFQQFRFRKQGESLAIFFEQQLLGELEITPGPARPGLKKPDRKNIEMVRVTAL